MLHKLFLQVQKRPEFAVLAAVIIVFTGFALTGRNFVTLESLGGILTVAAELGIIAAGETFVIISGEFDLSVGSVLGVSGMVFAIAAKGGLPHFLALLLALGAAAVVGYINGQIVLKTGISSFIATLGTMWLWRGVILAVTGGFPVRYWGDSTLLIALNGRLATFFRFSAVWFFLVVGVLAFVLTKTRYGNWVFATGGSKETARVMGVPVNRVKLYNFVLCSVLAGLAGCIQFARFHNIDPSRGLGYELQAIAATAVGGTLLTGGYGSIIGTMLGALLIGMIRSGLVMAGAPSYWYQGFVGLILIVAVVINTRLRRWAAR